MIKGLVYDKSLHQYRKYRKREIINKISQCFFCIRPVYTKGICRFHYDKVRFKLRDKSYPKPTKKCLFCDKPVLAKGLCRFCYDKNRSDPRNKVYPKSLKSIRNCSVCGGKCYAKGFCRFHYNESRKNEIRIYNKIWCEFNQDEIKKYKKIYRKSYQKSERGKEVLQMASRRRRAIKAAVNFWEPWMDDVWKSMIEETNGICLGYKRKSHYVGKDKLTMDHIIPLDLVDKLGRERAIELGAIHHINNAQPLCKPCNSKKHNKID